MLRLLLPAVLTTLLVLGGGTVAQDKKDIIKKDVKKDETVPKAKGFLPMNWGKIGLSDTQKQEIYTIRGSTTRRSTKWRRRSRN